MLEIYLVIIIYLLDDLIQTALKRRLNQVLIGIKLEFFYKTGKSRITDPGLACFKHALSSALIKVCC